MEKYSKEYFIAKGAVGGSKTKERHGVEHFKRISALPRKRKAVDNKPLDIKTEKE